MKRFKVHNRPPVNVAGIIVMILILILFVTFLQENLWSQGIIRGTMGTVNYVEQDWRMESSDGVFQSTVQMHDFIKLDREKTYRISKSLTYDGKVDEMPYGFIHVDHMYCRVLLEGEVLFSYMPENVRKWDKAKSPGYIYKAFQLPQDCQGKTLEVEFVPGLDVPMAYEIPDVVLGDYRSTIRTYVIRDMPHNILTIVCMLLGFSALLLSAVSLSGSGYREGFNIGTFALLVSLYFLSEARSNYYLIGNPYYLYFLNYTMFSLMPVSFMGFMRELMTGRQRKTCTKVIVVETVLFLAEMGMHLTGILDMREVLPVVHAVAFGEVILVLVMLLTIQDRRRKMQLFLLLIPVVVGMTADGLIYWLHLDGISNDATFTTIGLMVFLFKELITKLVAQTRKLTDMQQHTIEGMATLIESRDGSTGAHVRNTGVYARMIAEEMHRRHMYPRVITRDFVDMIGRIAPLHDVGKIKISDVVLNKPGKLTDEEYEIMKSHALEGGKIIGEILRRDLDSRTLEMAENIASYHHERWDGKGYPSGKKGTEIPLCARIMAVADVFDALSSKRVYKKSMDIDEVLNEMVANEGTQFQKEIVEVFVTLRPQIQAYLQSINQDTV